ncbi:Z1 domain-containing protein [Glycomyces tritici]|uniref:Z1 domain-containing protein n=1 Tax=Glycomyces tritici TaxID=2665176 RepID=A0ABT7YJ71_9ACTN|nr:Z1 domain-containing protein [Glycomyces tritici]MDN3238676.1 Z1 domain-containing protein [Glycomyces tritici]
MHEVSDVRVALHQAVLGDMATSKPKRLQKSLTYQAEDIEPSDLARSCASEDDFRQTLREVSSTDRLVDMWRKRLTSWDYADGPSWSQASSRTEERRGDIYDRLELGPETRKLLSQLIPVYKTEAPVVISDTHREWYSTTELHGREWYWPKYLDLLSAKGWLDHAIGAVNDASGKVVERLANPSDPEIYQSRGLVVGHVQSGKTANFTGVIAKAMDAGYRLVIVLSGTLNILRAQTQRRLDMELVGRENILRGASEFESDYADDPAWAKGQFATFGALPSALGGFDIVRMTTSVEDYKSLLQGIVALEFEKQEPALPLYDPQNLHRSSARLMVVKKHKGVLAKLVKDLNKIKTPLSEIPVLIIDDEADEASVNTSNPARTAKRTAINQKISELLRLLPRAQYVGYTATPYANVFVDPSDAEDIYPKDFIISLLPPDGYMGARDFHDFDLPIDAEERTVANSNEKSHVRDILIQGENDDPCLQEAMDMFILTAAMKLYREEEGGLGAGHFTHHTMLIHESVRQSVHRELLGRVTKLWWGAGYTGENGHERLRRLFESDILPVSRARAKGEAVPSTFDELARHVGTALNRIGGDDQPIIVVNGDKDIETGKADFDKRPIWKILIGGQSLSRGFTVEGLTISYFRRSTNNASTLMQMGRWFGFRDGYRDLVRLYLGREEIVGRRKVDLYELFEAICLDEEAFRSELRQYSEPVNGEPQIRPKDVPPLVSAHLPHIKPTSVNKMYNTRLVERGSAGDWHEPSAYPKQTAVSDLRHNVNTWTSVFESLSTEPKEFSHPGDGRGKYRFSALTGELSATEFLKLVSDLRWSDDGVRFLPNLAFLKKITQGERPKVDDWLVLAPQHNLDNTFTLEVNGRSYSWFARDRRRESLFGAIGDPKHRPAALRIAGAKTEVGNEVTESMKSPRRGVVVLYPVVEWDNRLEIGESGDIDPGKLVMTFAFVAPASSQSSDGRVVRFEAIDSGKGLVIDVGE